MGRYPEKPQKAYYYGTCLVDMMYPEAGMAGIKLLQQEGVKVIFPVRPNLLRSTGLQFRISG